MSKNSILDKSELGYTRARHPRYIHTDLKTQDFSTLDLADDVAGPGGLLLDDLDGIHVTYHIPGAEHPSFKADSERLKLRSRFFRCLGRLINP